MCDPNFYAMKEFQQEMGIDHEQLATLYRVFIEELLLQSGQLYHFFHNGEWDSFKKTLHNIKGISVTYRIHDVYDLSSSIYRSFKEHPQKSLETELGLLNDTINEAIPKIYAHFQQYGIVL